MSKLLDLCCQSLNWQFRYNGRAKLMRLPYVGVLSDFLLAGVSPLESLPHRYFIVNTVSNSGATAEPVLSLRVLLGLMNKYSYAASSCS